MSKQVAAETREHLLSKPPKYLCKRTSLMETIRCPSFDPCGLAATARYHICTHTWSFVCCGFVPNFHNETNMCRTGQLPDEVIPFDFCSRVPIIDVWSAFSTERKPHETNLEKKIDRSSAQCPNDPSCQIPYVTCDFMQRLSCTVLPVPNSSVPI